MPTSSQKWQRRSEARPQEILDAALALFAEKGFAATRMDEIASAAGVTKGTIYLYFESKERIFRALVEGSIGSTISDMEARIADYAGSMRDLLRFMLRAIGEFITVSDRVVLPKILIAEAGNFPEMVRFYRQEIIDHGLSLMSGVITRGMECGDFRKVAPEHVARICIAPILLAAFWRTTFAQFDSEPYDYHGLIETHIDTLLRGLSPDEGVP